MKAIDDKILGELKTLPQNQKEQVLTFIEGLKAGSATKPQSTQAPDSVSEDAPEYITPENIIIQFKSLPSKFQHDFIQYLKKLKVKAAHEQAGAQPGKPQSKFKPGFGGAKGLFKKLPDDLAEYSAAEDFEEYL